jgi:hypothetical protein
MVNVLLYSLLEFASGFSPHLTVLIVRRALYGIAMGGEWVLEELLKSQMAVWQTAAQPLVIAAQGAVAGIEQHQLLAAVHNGWNERLDAIGAGAKPATLLGNLLI